MIDPLALFVNCCRSSGLAIATAEVLDCMGQLRYIDLLDESQFKSVLQTNFVKSYRLIPQFEKLYDLFFHQLKSDLPTWHTDSQTDLMTDMQTYLENSVTGDLDTDIIDFLFDDPNAFLQQLYKIQTLSEEHQQGVKSNMSALNMRLSIMLTINQVRSRMATFSGDNHSQQDIHEVIDLLERRLDRANALLRDDFTYDDDHIQVVRSKDSYRKNLGDVPFSDLSPDEIEEMRDVVNGLVRKLKDVVGRRYAAMRKGRIDIKKTLRRADKFQGVPMQLVYRNRPPKKGKIVTLCDVSGSVWSAARFMLNLIYSIQEYFSQVNSFVFVGGLTEVTDTLNRFDINAAIETIMNNPAINYQDHTDYGETFRQFYKSHMPCLNLKTTLIIVGDGRSNYLNPQGHILEEMRNHSCRVIWLNPEPERFWNTGDSEMKTYSQHCHEVRPCINLNQLMSFIEHLVL
ncbi:MAG: VWA containing CoxE family protein [Candidatus Magnetoglobus multicellularis str. Araruama]|uniref:VWA containing CoxE family protein n=1 Tax=Candidatus Magnetoglobus multicellularis str. Araruama TaxID=890399 RepID=A0A1V1PHR6_9BACT|nr:MAG: VWA containing CoxE family protein [Candidatus Magnetoglobus multicellularis str. Araruama]